MRPPRVVKLVARPSDGGRLLTEISPDLVGAANYVEKTNFRRLDDNEVLREGNLLFAPVVGPVNQHVPPSGDPCLGMWEASRPNGDKCLVYATASAIYKFNTSTGAWSTLGTGFTGTKRWQSASSDGWLFLNNGVDLPVSYRVEDATVQPVKEMRDVGIAFVDTICAINGFLLLGGVAEIPAANLAAIMNGATPYGPIAPASTNHVRYKIVCSDYLQPTNYAPVINGTITSADRTKVTLDFVPSGFVVGTKLAVIGAGVDGGTLGGTEGIEDGVPITNITGNVITLSTAADVALTYPLSVQCTRFADVSTFSSSSSIQDDGSAIVAMVPLKRVLVVFRETGIFTGRYTAQVETPFVFTPEYSGADVPAYPHAIAEVSGDYLLYPSGNRFFYYDGGGAPQVHAPTDSARGLFFDTATSASYSAHNPVTKEIWFVTPGGTLAFDYVKSTTSFIDLSPAACVTLTTLSENWFVTKETAGLSRYGLSVAGPLVYTRNSESYTARIVFGVSDFNDPLSQKVLRGYTPLMPAGSENPVYKITLRTGNDVQDLHPVWDYTATDSHDSPTHATYFRDLYFQDLIEYVDPRATPFRLAGRAFQFYGVDSRGSTRTHNGHY